jgi:PAS domain S-box-containing protein
LAERMEKMYAEVRTLLAAQADCLVKNERLSSRVAVMEAMLKRTQDEMAARDVGTYVDAIIVADQFGTIRQWNEAATVLFQWLAHEAIGRHVHVLIPDEGREEHNKRWLDIINPGTSESIRRGPYTVEAVNKSGERFPVEIILSSWLDQGRRFVTASIRKAITDRLGRTLAQMPNPAQSAITAAAQEIVESISSSRLRKANEAQAPVQQQTPKETEDVDLGQ